MSDNPLKPYFNRVPTADELASLPLLELIRISEAASDAENLDSMDLEQTRQWAASVKNAALDAIKKRTKQ